MEQEGLLQNDVQQEDMDQNFAPCSPWAARWEP